MVWAAVYVVVVGLATALEHVMLARAWRRHELARWTLGVATVLGAALGLVGLGEMAFGDWLLILFGFGAAGAVTGGLYVSDAARINERAHDEIARAD